MNAIIVNALSRLAEQDAVMAAEDHGGEGAGVSQGLVDACFAARVKTYAAFAAFVVAGCGDRIAATSRPSGGIGLPGGKIEAGETGEMAARREASEEGWRIAGPLTLCHVAQVEGKMVEWYKAAGVAEKRLNWLEEGRIVPVCATPSEVAESGFGNDSYAVRTAMKEVVS